MTSESDGRDGDAVLMPPGAGESFWFLRNRLTVKATTEQTGGAFELFEYLLPPGSAPPLHIHRREEESFWILDGRVTMRLGDTTFAAEPGAFLCLPRDVPHQFVVEGDSPARMLVMLTPGNGLGFFTDDGLTPEHDGLPPVAAVDMAAVNRLAARYGVEIVGPPMSPLEPTG